MKKKSLVLFAIYYLIFNISVAIAAENPTPTPDNDSNQNPIKQQITDLKTRIASRVAELKLVEKRGSIATVTEVSGTQITTTDIKGNTRFIDVDELTQFSNPASTDSFGISDIAKGDTIGILGLYNKESRRILARFVNIVSLPVIVHGVIDSINKELFRFKIITENNKEVFLDVEKTTLISSYSKDKGLVRSGFSKINGNERVIAVGEKSSDDKNLITATRIIILLEIPKNPNKEDS